MYNNFAGIDIGRYGAISLITPDDIEIFKMPSRGKGKNILPNGKEIHKIISSFPDKTFVAVESQQPYKGQGLVSSFTLARYYESVITSVEIAGHDYKTVNPKTWKGEFGLDSMKIKSLIKMAYLFPNAYKKFIKQNKCGGFDSDQDGMAESLLLAHYGQVFICKV